MFASLSQDVILSILMEYVGIDMRGLAGLDRAATNHSTRPDWLSVLHMVKPAASKKTTERLDCYNPLELLSYLRWLACRGVTAKQLVVDPHQVCRKVLTFCSSTRLPGISAISFVCNEVNKNKRVSLAALIDCLPDLEAIDCERWPAVSDFHLKHFQPLRPIRCLNLMGCEEITAAAVLGMITYPDSLRELRCSVLTDDEIETMAGTCCNLETLVLETNFVTSLQCVERLCVHAKYLTKICLKDVVLRYSNHALATLITIVATACSHLKQLFILMTTCFAGMLDASIAAHVVMHCPQIEALELPFARFEICDRRCDLQWNGKYGAPLNDLFRNFPLPIVAFEGLNLPPMKLLSEAAKRNLEKLRLRDDLSGIFKDIVLTDGLVQEIALSFPNLTAISLLGCYDLTDAAMASLAARCRLLKSIVLHDSEYISDVGLIGLFETCTDIEQIVIAGMDHVTHRVLLKIADLFPNLHTLGLIDLLIPSSTIVSFILERKLKMKVFLSDDAKWIEDKLKEKHFHPLPEFHDGGRGGRRWGEL